MINKKINIKIIYVCNGIISFNINFEYNIVTIKTIIKKIIFINITLIFLPI